MRTLMLSVMAVLACLTLASAAIAAQPSPQAGPTEQTGLTRDDAVSLVLATDPRYADLPDFARLEIESSANFDLGIKFGSDYYRVLPTLPTQYLGQGFIDFHYPGNWVIEATLVRDCVSIREALDPTAGLRDPCGWRHSWFYRVQPDGTVSLLFDEGDPDPSPQRDGQRRRATLPAYDAHGERRQPHGRVIDHALNVQAERERQADEQARIAQSIAMSKAIREHREKWDAVALAEEDRWSGISYRLAFGLEVSAEAKRWHDEVLAKRRAQYRRTKGES